MSSRAPGPRGEHDRCLNGPAVPLRAFQAWRCPFCRPAAWGHTRAEAHSPAIRLPPRPCVDHAATTRGCS